LKTYVLRLSTFMKTTLNLFKINNPSMQQHFKDHLMASTTPNFRPWTCTLLHKDLKNLSWGLQLSDSFLIFHGLRPGLIATVLVGCHIIDKVWTKYFHC